MIDSKEKATVMFKLTEKEASILIEALRAYCTTPEHGMVPFGALGPLMRNLEKDHRTMRAINKANAKGWK
jgi:hypothetical protein|tara:strand:+ start:319 stop:528 length:210 start_codon:yes stop_codon:yes gene_type:complete